MAETKNTKPANKQAVKKTPWVKMDGEAHREKFNKDYEKHSYMFFNKLHRPLPLNLCQGVDAHRWQTDENNNPKVRPNLPENIKSCPGFSILLRTREKREISLHHDECVNLSIHVQSLILNKSLIVKKKVNGEWKTLTISDLENTQATFEKSLKGDK